MRFAQQSTCGVLWFLLVYDNLPTYSHNYIPVDLVSSVWLSHQTPSQCSKLEWSGYARLKFVRIHFAPNSDRRSCCFFIEISSKLLDCGPWCYALTRRELLLGG